jgi:hypothetical protein
MIAVRIIVGLLAVGALGVVFTSVLHTVVLPRAVPTRLGRLTFLGVRLLLLARLRRRHEFAARDRVLALQAPLSVFGQLFVWSMVSFIAFAGLFAAVGPGLGGADLIARPLELSGSSICTLGFVRPTGFLSDIVAFSDAGLGLTLLTLVITYLPSLYSAFSQREVLVAKLTVRAGGVPSGPRLLARSWELGRFDQLEEVWNRWEDWFIEVGESHTTFPQLVFFRSPHPENHWVLAAEAVLDGAALLMSACDVPRQSRSELCVEAGVGAFDAITEFLGTPHRPSDADEPEIALTRERFDSALADLSRVGVPLREDRDAAWREFGRMRHRYEPMVTVVGSMVEAPRSDWSSWTEDTPRYSPPLLRINRG